ncbi:MAG: hypothetical protein WBW31_01405 [Candidatus Sulfotelmatobacter sp.]
MARLLCILLIVAFAVCTATTLAGNPDDRRFSRETRTVDERASFAPQKPAEDGSTVNAILKASSQAGNTADVQISNAIAAIAHRSGIVWADYSTNQTWAACPTWGTQNITLVLYPVTHDIATNCTIPSNVTLQFSKGSCLAPADGTTTTIKGYFTAPMSKIFCNAVAGEGAVMLASANSSDDGGQALIEVFPEWWGATAGDASGATNGPALQAGIIGAYGNNRTNSTVYPKYNRVLHFSTLYNINKELQIHHMIGFRWEGENQFGSGLRQLTCGLRIIDGQSVAYGRFENLRFENGCGGKSGAALVDIDYSGAQGADLSPQNITFYDDFFAGAGLTDVGVLIAKSGGGAQGDNIRCYNCYFNGFTGAGWQIGGNNTGRNAGRYYAQNAIKEQIIGGDIQGCPLYGVAVYGGSIEVNGTTMENDSAGFGTQTGFDIYCEAPQDRCMVRSVRSESHKLAAGNPILVEHSRTIFQATQWYSAGRSQSMADTSWPVGTVFSGTGQGGDGKYYQIKTHGRFGGVGLTSATGGGSSTTISNSAGTWPSNTFAGQQATIVSGIGNGEYCLITSNTATVITCAAGWVTNYYQLAIVNPDTSSRFVVEPNWGSHPTASGTITFVPFNFNVIEGNAGAAIADGELYDVSAPGGQIKIAGPYSELKQVFVSRADWNSAGFVLEDSLQLADYDDIYIEKPDQDINIGGTTKRIPWMFFRNSDGNSFYSGVTQKNMGTKPICWSYGQNGEGRSANDVCIGIRTDNRSLNSAGRAVLGILGTVGPATPFGANKAGVDLPVSGGLSTGKGVPGGISFRLGTEGAAGNQVNDSTEVSRIDDNGYKLPSFTFAKLPAAPNGYVVFCTNCNSGCTAGGGTGRTCFRENGAWTH